MGLTCTMYRGDCLEVMPTLPKASVQMVFADLPYAVDGRKHTANYWDFPVDLNAFWRSLEGIPDKQSCCLMPGNMPLCAMLYLSNTKHFRYDLIAERYFATGFLNSKRQPLRKHDIIMVFSFGKHVFNPQMTDGAAYSETSRRPSCNYGAQRKITTVSNGARYPVSVFRPAYEPERRRGKVRSFHPTQKPVTLLGWLIRTYSSPGDHVLDPVSGSATTAVAGLACGRSVTCIEKDTAYFEAGVERVRKHIADNQIDAKVEVRR